ncbi:hypothetical protein EW145_g986 [Phellinidium pouzarii]|uniref:Uncharacterized protein n=1 Tax=Phellinidium pouzarii TaxID=167371 RepID=A0A4S4LHZ2_9AGAM|nr:hypothetical protein EW145_g986 [Phellinidium pouzarii]
MPARTALEPIFEPGALYAILLYSKDDNHLECALFVPDVDEPESAAGTGTGGFLCHCTNKTATDWAYELETPKDINLRSCLVLGVRLANLASLGSHAVVALSLEEILRNVPVWGNNHGSVPVSHDWLLDCIAALHDVGFLQCEDINAFERELVSAVKASAIEYKEDKSFRIISSRYCSDF